MSAFWSALAVVFVAELGDKTQLVALGLGARHRLSLVLAGMALAYLATNLFSVIAGALLGAALPTRLVGVLGGVLFVGFAVWTLVDADDSDDERDDTIDDQIGAPDAAGAPATTIRSPARVVGSVAGAMFVAEFGDKTMLATATLASTRSPVLVWAGATVGIFLAGALGALAGRAVGARLPARAVRVGAAVLFAAFGVALIVTSM